MKEGKGTSVHSVEILSERKCRCCAWPKAEEPAVPALAGLMQASDTLLYTCVCIDGILPSHHEICWID